MSTQAYPPSYRAYQPQATTTSGSYHTGHYPTHYPQIHLAQNPYSLAPIQHHPRYSPQPELPPPPPDLTSVSPKVASQAVERLILVGLKDAGFNAAEPVALQRLECEVVAFVEKLYEHAHQYANLANRAGPIAKDLMLACKDNNLDSKDLRRAGLNHSRKRKRDTTKIRDAPTLVPPPSRSPSPQMLPSDDEDAFPVIPVTLRALPSYFPDLPPKHTYLRTPLSPPKKAALPSLEKKLKTAGLVQQSLKNLMLATEDSSGQEDGELLGHIVNWEAGFHPRKRWKVDSSTHAHSDTVV